MMSEMILEYDPSMLEICGISQGPIFKMAKNSIFIYEIDSETGTVQINTTLLDGGNPFVSGTGGLAEIQVRVLKLDQLQSVLIIIVYLLILKTTV